MSTRLHSVRSPLTYLGLACATLAIADRKGLHRRGAGPCRCARSQRTRAWANWRCVTTPRDDGAVVIHPVDAGYRSANRFASAAGRIVADYVHVITDDVPGAVSARRL